MTDLAALVRAFGSQAAVARAAGVSRSAVSNWRTAGVPLRQRIALLKIARDQELALRAADLGLDDLIEPRAA